MNKKLNGIMYRCNQYERGCTISSSPRIAGNCNTCSHSLWGDHNSKKWKTKVKEKFNVTDEEIMEHFEIDPDLY